MRRARQHLPKSMITSTVGQYQHLLGWTKFTTAIGFRLPSEHQSQQYSPLFYRGDGHILTCAPTGSGKFVSVAGPSLSEYPGQATVVVLDPKGEAYHVFHSRREELGSHVVLIDPFHRINVTSDQANPFDLFKLPNALADSDAELLAACLCEGHEFTSDRYWSDTGTGMTSGVIRFIASLSQEMQTFKYLHEFMHQDDTDYAMAQLLDQNKVPHGLARNEFVSYLQTPSDKTRPCILSTARSFVKSLGGTEALSVLGPSTFSLRDVYDGKGMTIFIVFPPDKLTSHKNLLRLIMHVLLTTMSRRQVIPQYPSLLLLDEAASLGDLPVLRQALTLFRGVGVIVHSIWQDLSQIRSAHPKDWETILNNCGVLQCFNLHNNLLAESWANILGCSAKKLLTMAEDEQALYVQNQGLIFARKLNYLKDAFFQGKYDFNPRYARVNSQKILSH